MKAQSLSLFIGMSLAALLNACQADGPEGIICTEEFRSVTLKIAGEPLTDFYTVRLATSDTIRRKTDFLPENNWYWVLDDSYHKMLANRKETFRFIGKRGNAIVVEEEYVIGADECHIFKVSGKSEI